MKKTLSIILALIMVLGLLAGCGQSSTTEAQTSDAPAVEPATAKPGEGKKLGMLQLSAFGIPSMIEAENSIKNLCEYYGIEVVTAPVTGYDDASLIATYEQLINEGCNAVSVYTFSEGTIGLLADVFEEAGVNWFLANRHVTDPALIEKVFATKMLVGNCYCQEEEVAYDMVCKMADEMGVKNLAVIGLQEGDINGDYRDKGIARACEEKGITLLTETRGIASVDDVTNSIESIIASYPELDGIFIVGGAVTTGALAGASQALANHNMSDKVSIAMIDFATGMGDYMGEGNPLKLVAGGNLTMDMYLSAASLVNCLLGENVDDQPYELHTSMMYITSPEEAADYEEYCENVDIPLISGESWEKYFIGKSIDEIQTFVTNYSIATAKEMRG